MKTQRQSDDLGTIDWSECDVVERDRNRMSGAWCFKDTRITVASLFEYLAGGVSIEEYLDQFPDARSERVTRLLHFQAERLKATWRR